MSGGAGVNDWRVRGLWCCGAVAVSVFDLPAVLEAGAPLIFSNDAIPHDRLW